MRYRQLKIGSACFFVFENGLLTELFFCLFIPILRFIYRLSVSTSLSAEKWSPPEGGKWEEKDFESDLKKLEKEAEERLDAKISEMMSKVESTGAN